MKYETVHSWGKCVTVVWQDKFKLLWVLFTFPEKKKNDQTLFSPDIAVIHDQRINSIQVLRIVHMLIEVTHKYVDEGFVRGEQVTQRQLQPPCKAHPCTNDASYNLHSWRSLHGLREAWFVSLFSIVMITASWPWGYPSEFYKAWVVYFLGRISFVYFLNFHFLHSILKNDFTVKVVTLILFVTEQERHKSAELPNRLVRTTEKQSQFCLPSCHILGFWIGEN